MVRNTHRQFHNRPLYECPLMDRGHAGAQADRAFMPFLISHEMRIAYERLLCAPIPVTHELISVFVKSYSERQTFLSCVMREPTFFCLGFCLFFLESISQIRENEQKLGRMLFSQVTICCGMTPYLI